MKVALADAYYRAGRFAEARPLLEEAQRTNPAGIEARRASELLKHFPAR